MGEERPHRHGTGFHPCVSYTLASVLSLGIQVVWAITDWASLPFRSLDRTISREEDRPRVITQRRVAVRAGGPLECSLNYQTFLVPRGRTVLPLAELWAAGLLAHLTGDLPVSCKEAADSWTADRVISLESFFGQDVATLSALRSPPGQAERKGDGRVVTFHSAKFIEATTELVLTGRYLATFALSERVSVGTGRPKVSLLTRDAGFLLPLTLNERRYGSVRGRWIRRTDGRIDLED